MTNSRYIFQRSQMRVIILLIVAGLMIMLQPVQAQNTDGAGQPELSGMIGYGLTSATDSGQWRTYHIEPNTSFVGRFMLDNQRPATDFVLTCLLDYQQVPCQWGENQIEAILFDITLEAAEQRHIQVISPPMHEGAHDFSVLAIENAFSDNLDNSYRISTDYNYLYGMRVVVIAGESMTFPAVDESHLLPGEQATASVAFDGLIVNRLTDRTQLKAWPVEEVAPGESLSYSIHFANRSQPYAERRFAVMAFLNYEQIPVTDEMLTAFLDMEMGTELTLPAEVTLPDQSGVHELMIVSTDDPYHMLETPPFGDDRELVFINRNFYSSIRTAIVVDGS